MITKEIIQAKLDTLRESRQQDIANVNVKAGAIQILEQWLADLDAPVISLDAVTEPDTQTEG